MTRSYSDFIASKAIDDPCTGIIDVPELPASLFPHQRDIVNWALRRGRAALFAGTGLGKSLMEMAWAQAVRSEGVGSGKRVAVRVDLGGRRILKKKKNKA